MNSYYKKWVFRSTTGVILFMAGISGILGTAFLLFQKAGVYPILASAVTGIAGTTIGMVLFGNSVLQRVRYERSKSHPKRSHRQATMEYTES
jgi:sorbitol-specific phosphotransferase system component IIC